MFKAKQLLFPLAVICFLFITSCREARITEHDDWKKYFEEYGIKDGCFIINNQTHEAVDYYNKERCLQRFTPASTFKIFNSLVALESRAVKDENDILPWDGVVRREEWNKPMSLTEAFKVSNLPVYQAISRKISRETYQHFLDTIHYGNMQIGKEIDQFWIDNSLQISADEQVGFIKRMYFEQLPFTLRTQTIVRGMMLREDSNGNKLYYKTGWGYQPNGKSILWVVGFVEHKELVKEHKNSMNKSNERNYPYFFALNFDVPKDDQSKDWAAARIELLKKLLTADDAFDKR